MPKFIAGILLFFLLTYHLKAQFTNRVFEDKPSIEKADSGKLYLGIITFNYFKNNEYFNRIVDGYTLFGYQLQPRITYFPNTNVRIDLGAYLRKDFGNDEYSAIDPTFSITYQQNRFKFIFGTIQGNINHRLVDPLYDFERAITNRLENGIQFLWDGKVSELDLWVDWEKMIYRKSPFQERIAGGLHYVLKPIENESWKMKFPLQLTVAHKGGQIDTIDAPIYTFINSAIGVDVEKSLSSPLLNSVGTSFYYVSHNDLSPITQSGFKLGKGFLTNVNFTNKYFYLMLSYWKGDGFISSRGGKIYQSISDRVSDPDFLEEKRELLFLRIFKDFKIFDNLIITARLEPVFDFNSSKFEYSYGLYINYKQDFLLLSPKKRE